MSAQAEDYRIASDKTEKESSFLEVLKKRHQNTSGVNIDQELAEMIRVQSHYAAAARMISTENNMLNDLLDVFR